jgi:tetratricopeptide (TPR) repeat protein
VRRYLTVTVASLVCSVSFAEYPELAALKRSSREALRRYGQQMATDDPKFEGIVKFGETLNAIEDANKVDLAKLTYQGKDYWRAVLEATPSDSSVLLAHAHLHAARGEIGHADTYFLLASMALDERRREELGTYTRLRDALNARAQQDIDKGIRLHELRRYKRAIAVYDRVLAEHPHCGIAFYEKGFAYLMLSKSRPAMKEEAEAMYAECRRRAPFLWKAYQGGGATVVAKLKMCLEKVEPFVSGKQRTKETFAAFAEGCEALELYPIAAHARWKLAMIDSDNVRTHVGTFLDLIEKCGCADAEFFRRQFRLTQNDAVDAQGTQ